MTDLTTARDHPAVVLTHSGFSDAADVLYNYEREGDVTFAALDNSALEAVVEAYEDGTDPSEFISAVVDLLGLGD